MTTTDDHIRTTYALPFGRYEAAGPGEFPTNETLVGRERERARMLDWLLTAGNRGAYLVTGYRGVGKSSLVQFCIKQYEEDVYGRYLQSKVGRAIFWDRIFLIVLLALALVVPLLAAQLLHIGLAGFGDGARLAIVFRAVLLGPLLLLVLYPGMYGFNVLRTATRVTAGAGWHQKGLIALRYSVFIGATALAACVLSRTHRLFDTPSETASYFVALLAWAYLVVSATSLLVIHPDAVNSQSRDPLGLAVSVGLMPVGAIALTQLPGGASAEMTIAVWCSTLASLMRALDARGKERYLLERCLDQNVEFAIAVKARRIHTVLCIAGTLAAIFLVSNVNSDFAATKELLAWSAAVGATPTFLGWILRRHLRWKATQPVVEKPDTAQPTECSAPGRSATADSVAYRLVPMPRALLVVKGLFYLTFTSQIVQPIVGTLWPSAQNATTSNVDATLSDSFAGPHAELAWLLPATLFCWAVMYLEQDWILRRDESARRDDAYDPRPETPPPPGSQSRLAYLRSTRELADATLFSSIFRILLPTLTVRVNLGFDNLSHTHIVASMLAGLRDEYHRHFISSRSPLRVAWRLASLAIVAVISLSLSQWISDSSLPPSADTGATASATQGLAARADGCPDRPEITVRSAWSWPLRCIRDERISQTELLTYILPYATAAAGSSRPAISRIIVFRTYHVLFFFGLLAVSGAVGRRVRSHKEAHARLLKILDSLSSSVQTARMSSKLRLSKVVEFEGPSESIRVDTPPLDPRTVEQAFLELLRDLQEPYLPLPLAGHIISLPAPQITFVLDELDKIAPRSSDRSLKGPGDSVSTDRDRSRKLHRLLADMKNLLSVAPAKFIFVGGRDLHDEWLADRTARHPLLSNVFDAEIYVPTLLVDPARGAAQSAPIDGVRSYLAAQFERTRLLHERWQSGKVWATVFDVVRDPPEHFFLQREFVDWPSQGEWDVWEVRPEHGSARPLKQEWQKTFLADFLKYLAFRSRGNPKRLDAIVEGMVHPVGRIVKSSEIRAEKFDCQHVLHFSYADRLSVGFIGAIYTRICALVDTRVACRDDKVIRSIFYLADFLFKYHRRAFSLSSLERIDELQHAHRAPDLRNLLEELLLSWSTCFIHPILNGMYSFRFRGEFAAEVRYISRRSEVQMAAFNFTLDESQSVKRDYQRRLEALSKNDDFLFETRAALGELEDFDEDFEHARRHYYAAIRALDDQMLHVLGSGSKDGILVQVLNAGVPGGRSIPPPASQLTADGSIPPSKDGSPGIRHPLRRQVEWCVSRLRLMLQIGMTYERSKNHERALVEYRNAHTLARAAWFAMLDDYAREKEERSLEGPKSEGPNRLETLKHLHIVYQPLFACAWVAEKAPSGVDTSLGVVEEGLRDIRANLPFVRERGASPPTHTKALVTHSNFSLAMSDLHHNAGNLYFFKGRQSAAGAQTDVGQGYLLQSSYHYAVALHEVR